MNARPLAVTVIGWLYVVVGASALVMHMHGFAVRDLSRFDVLGVGLVEVAAMVAGAFLLCGRNWARWLAVAWIAAHVVLSAFFAFSQFAFHCLIGAGIVYLLLRRDAAEYFAAAG